jgi:hypothetical protein
MQPLSSPERWQLQADDAPGATLLIPADARRERRFEIGCAITVQRPAETAQAWHQMTVLANGVKQWSRRVPTQNPGTYDGLDYRFAHTVPVGQALRVSVAVAGQGVRRRSLVIEADEI